MKKGSRRLFAFGLILAAAGCASSAPQGEEMTGTATFAVENVPADGTCIQVTVAGYRTTVRSFDAVAGSSSVFALNGLPLGSDSFSAAAFSGACAMVNPMTIPNWISAQNITANVAVQPPVGVTIEMQRNGNASVGVDFPNEPDGSAPDAMSACMPGLTNCAGACVNLTSDPNNCGQCGDVCAMGPNSSSRCQAGACVQSCAAGFANCTGMPMAGCTTNLSSDVNNCGSCGTTCNGVPNTAMSACTMARCSILACNAGFADCDALAANGCETNVTNNVSSCGQCGHVCTNTANVSSTTCVSAACSIQVCQAAFADCNGVYADGCEINLANDPNNCGGCGHHCTGATPVCQNGVCTL
jgi:hypothetical protein